MCVKRLRVRLEEQLCVKRLTDETGGTNLCRCPEETETGSQLRVKRLRMRLEGQLCVKRLSVRPPRTLCVKRLTVRPPRTTVCEETESETGTTAVV